MEAMGVASGRGCKEIYRFSHITYPYSSCISSFFAASLLFVHFFNVFLSCSRTFVIYVIIFSRSINTHTGDYGRTKEAI